jgi:spore maturation protein CgeB
MKLLLAGNWKYEWYEEACTRALRELGVQIIPFQFSRFFLNYWGKAQTVVPFPGPALIRLNQALLQAVVKERPDWVYVWRGTHVLPWTLRLMRKKTSVRLMSYNNDDPFGPRAHGNVPWHHYVLWFWYTRTLKEYDANFVYRPINIGEVTAAGGKNVRVLKPYFVPWLHRPVELSEEDFRNYGCDVVFVGHYEPDGRENYIRALIKDGFHVRIFGSDYWNTRAPQDLREHVGIVRPVYGDDYSKALCGARIALGLLSRLNRDTYTRRHLEIPACGSLLLSERTSDLERMFKTDEEAVFFSSVEELVDRTRWLLGRPVERAKIARMGRARVWADGHDVVSRMREILQITREVDS